MLDHIIIALILTLLFLPYAYGSCVLYKRTNPGSVSQVFWFCFSVVAGVSLGAIVGSGATWFYSVPTAVAGFGFTMTMSTVAEQVDESHLWVIRNSLAARPPWLYGKPFVWSIVEVTDSNQCSKSADNVSLSARRVGRRRRVRRYR